jgi:hypothetical protein
MGTSCHGPGDWKAAAYGDLEKLREFVDADPQLVNSPDATGCVAPSTWGTTQSTKQDALFLATSTPPTVLEGMLPTVLEGTFRTVTLTLVRAQRRLSP